MQNFRLRRFTITIKRQFASGCIDLYSSDAKIKRTTWAERSCVHFEGTATVESLIDKAAWFILVPRAYDPSGLRQELRALGATIFK